MKKIFFFAMLMISLCLSAQMDYEHWFAPTFDSSNASQIDSNSGDYLYLSTDKSVPFEVTIYSGNTELSKVNISVGNPAYVKIPEGLITTTNISNIFSANMMGLHVTGDNKFFANLRLLRKNHAEIINSKGLAGLGETFYAAMAPLYEDKTHYNSQIGIIATENNTAVNISGFDPSFIFSDRNTYPSGISITLQKGESYIISAPYNPSTIKGLIGSKIESNHPICITNGNSTGTYINSTNTDILMDQSVPINKLGNDYVIAKGNGNISSTSSNPLAYEDDMERVLVVATNPLNPTDIYVNGIFYKRLSAGEYDFVYSNSYVDTDGSGNYSMSIKSVGGDVYIYQFLAGTDDSATTNATGGMNMIPALSCFLPNKIIELPELNQIGTRTDFNTKINVISQNGANVFLNGTKLIGHPIPANPNWELFVENNVTGNVSVVSDKAATAGIASGNGAVGFGGYFAGFSSVPSISKVGDCAKGQELVVDDIYDKYEWFYSLDNITYVSYPGTGNKILPGTKFGYYKCEVTKLSCLPSKTTKEFKYLKCTTIGSPKSYTIGACKSIIPITPQFTNSIAQPIDITKTFISQHPDGGKAYVDNHGMIHFDADNTTLDQVTFKYYFESTGTFPDSEEITVTVNIAQIRLINTEITECVDFDGEGYYDLKSSFEHVNQDPTFVKYTYYKDSALTQVIPSTELSVYHSKPNTVVYVVVTNSYDCDNMSNPAQIALKTFELPEIKTIDVIDGTSVSINAIGGKKPYRYYIRKGIAIQPLPLLQDYSLSDTLPVTDGKGLYTAFVKSADNSYDCNPVTQVFAVIGISNIITPNDDGKNDTIDMSILSYKMNPKFQVFDREGTKVFEGSSANKFIWTGKDNGSALPTSTYWYLLQWQDFEGADLDVMNGWILLKNRNSH